MTEIGNAKLTNIHLKMSDFELGLMDAGMGEGIATVKELQVMYYKTAMISADAEKWQFNVANKKA